MMISVNNECIGCGMCQGIAGANFKVDGVPAQVIKQPETPEEESLCKEAIQNCPVHAISSDVA